MTPSGDRSRGRAAASRWAWAVVSLASLSQLDAIGPTTAPLGTPGSGPLAPGQLYGLDAPAGSAWAAELAFATGRESYLLILSNRSREPSAEPLELRGTSTDASTGTTETTSGSPGRARIHGWRPWPELPRDAGPASLASAESLASAGTLPATDRRASAATAPRSSASAQRLFWLPALGETKDRAEAKPQLLSVRLAAERPGVRVYVDERSRVGADVPVWIAVCYAEQVAPRLAPWIGTPADVDGDGALSIVVTPGLSRLAGRGPRLGGLTVATDFDRASSAPGANRADCVYLADDQQPGPHLVSLIAHEVCHAVRAGHLARGPRQGWWGSGTPAWEHPWLNEGLAHVAENLAGPGLSNVEARVAAWLADPAAAPLVVPGGQALSLAREPRVRGASYLFLSWCVETRGLDLVRRLVTGSAVGEEALRTALGAPLEIADAWWAADAWLEAAGRSGLTSLANREPGSAAIRPRRLDEHWGRDRQRPLATREWTLGERTAETLHVAGTAHAYFVVRGRAPGAWRLEGQGRAGSRWRVQCLRLDAGETRLLASLP